MRTIVSLSSWSLDLGRDLLRLPPRPYAIRSETYEEAFDFATVVCDCFWDASNRNIILVGPPLLNLSGELQLSVAALPSGEPCRFDHHELDRLSRIVVRPPPGTTGLSIRSTVGEAIVAPQPSLAHVFAGKRVLLTLSRNNELIWIKDWVQFYRAHHGCEGVLLYDNNSDRYGLADLAEELQATFADIEFLVVNWPFTYGPFDGRSFPGYDAWDSIYCQTVMFEHARQRVLPLARSVLNVDIDELVLTADRTSIFDIVERSLTGHVVFTGAWVEHHRKRLVSDPNRPPRHKDYYFIRADEEDTTEAKWAVVPQRAPAHVQWLVNEIVGMPASPNLGQATLRHFKAVNTNWAVDRAFAATVRGETGAADASRLAPDHELRRALLAAARDLGRRRPAPVGRARVMSGQATYVAARKAAAAKRIDEALRLLETVVSDLPDHPGVLCALARLVEGSDPRRAQELMNKAAALRDADPWFNLQRGRWLAHREEADSALRYLERTIDLDPRLFHAYGAAYRLLWSQGAYLRAISYLERYLSANPDDPAARVVIAEALVLRGQISRAVQHTQAAVKAASGFPPAYLHLCRALVILGQLDAAEAAARTGLALYEGSSGSITPHHVHLTRRTTAEAVETPAAFHAALGNIQLLKSQPAGAEASLRTAISLGFSGADVWMKLADALDMLGRPEDSRAARDTAIAVATSERRKWSSVPWGPRVQQRGLDATSIKLSARLVSVDRAAEAVDLLQACCAKSPHNPALLSQLARLKASAGQIDEAETLLARAVEIEPENGDLEVALAQTIVGRDPERAAELALAAIDLEPANVLLVSTAAEVLMAAGRSAEAVAALRRMVEQEPRHAALRLRLSRALIKLGAADEAMRQAEAAVEINPYAPDPTQHLVSLYLQSNRLDAAEAVLDRALLRCPSNPTAHFLLSRVHRQRGRLDEAVAAARRAISLGLDQPHVRLHAADVLMQMKQGEDAVEILRQGIEREPSHAGLNFQLSQCLHRLGLQPEEALAAARRAVDLSPGRADFQAHLKRLTEETGVSG